MSRAIRRARAASTRGRLDTLRLATPLLLATLLLVPGCDEPGHDDSYGVLTVSVQRASQWARNFNPVSPASTPRWPTVAGIHEPLMVFNSVRSEFVPWLAHSSRWTDDHRTLRVQLRSGVLWSDGTAFDARDVVFTFELLREHPATDARGVWRFLGGVRTVDDLTIEFDFGRENVPRFADVVCQPILPEHVWSAVEDPIGFANATPVGTGPFTEILTFRDDLYEIGRNPYYWQDGVPAIDVLRLPAYPDNDASTMGLLYEGVDWSGDFIPAVERVFEAKEPDHHRSWSPLTGGCIFLYANTRRSPFDDPRVRKAISMTIDRRLVVDVAMFGYTRPADATGLTDAYASWRDSTAVRRGDWVRFDPEAARAALDESGFLVGADGLRRGALDQAPRPELLCVRGWTDWERAVEIIADGLHAVGIDARIQRLEFDAWQRRVSEGNFDLSIGWSLEGTSPYDFYRGLMDSRTVMPVGQPATVNWHRYASPRADALFDLYAGASDRATQTRLAHRLQHVFVQEAPAIPLFPGPSWSAVDTEHVTGFPTTEDPYADPSPNKFVRGETLLVLTKVRPAQTP